MLHRSPTYAGVPGFTPPGSRGIIKFQHNITVETRKYDILIFYLGRFQQQVPNNQFHLALIYLCLPRRAVADVGVNEFKVIVTLNQYEDKVPTWTFVFVWCDQFHREAWGNCLFQSDRG